jgi:hypothetical protein
MSISPPALDARIEVAGARYPNRSQTNDSDSESDRSGLLEIVTADGGAEIETKAAVLSPNIVYTGLSASVTEPISRLGFPVRIIVEQISNGGPIYADLYLDGRLVQSSSGRLSAERAAIEVRPEMPGLYRIQIYTTAIGPGNATAVRHFYVTDTNEDAVAGLRKLLNKLSASETDGKWADATLAMPLEQGGFDVQKAAAFVLSRLYRGHRHPESLISSRKEDDAELKAFKAKFQRMLMIAIIAIGLGVSCFVGLFALTAYRRQQRITQMILSDTEEEDGSTTPVAKGTGRVVFQGMILFLIMLGAFVSIAILVDTITWVGN